MDRNSLRSSFKYLLVVAILFGKCCLTRVDISPGHVAKNLLFMPSHQVDTEELNAAACKNTARSFFVCIW